MVTRSPTSNPERSEGIKLNPAVIVSIQEMYAEEANNIITQLQSLRPEVQKVAIDTIIAYRKATDANNQVFRQVAANDPIYLTDAEKSA